MLVEVALPVPLPQTFTYRAPVDIPAGTRVRVPFRNRRLTGWVVDGRPDAGDEARIRPIDAVLDDAPTIRPALLQLCRFISNYYVTPLGLVLRAALPVVLAGGRRDDEPVKKRRVLRIQGETLSLQQREDSFGRAQRQRDLYEFLEAVGGAADVAHLTSQAGFSAVIVKGLVARGLATIVEETVSRDPFAAIAVAEPPNHTLTSAQAAALRELKNAADQLRAQSEPAVLPFLLRGVTGSGKTLVYIELLRHVVLEQQRGAIVLVPEIALTPQTVARFRSHFGDNVAVLHSALSEGERYDAWRALFDGRKRIAIGARSAIFAPVADLGAIIVDEEHEASYKQSEAPRYHARELAIMRAKLERAVCVLGSATPSLESWHNAQSGKSRLLELPERVEGRPLPPVEIVDLRAIPREQMAPRSDRESAGLPILSARLREAIEDRLERGEQTILLLNRRGYASFVQCRSCGVVNQCRQCNVSLTYHRGRRRLVCHYCFHEEPAPVACAECGSGDLSFRGVGTEQVEREVADTFPTARITRMDIDTTSAKWSHHEILSRVERGDVDILLGTQMIAKGLDFPGVTLVGVVNADVAMNLPDFRASERTFQLLTQVAGRAGRGPRGGEVIIQTALPGHYAIRSAVRHDYAAFAARELQERQPPRYPPFFRLVNIVISGTDQGLVQEAAESAAAWTIARINNDRLPVELTGPAPCPIDRIRGRWRWHVLLRSTSAAALGTICRHLSADFEIRPGRADIRLILDRDPVSLL